MSSVEHPLHYNALHDRDGLRLAHLLGSGRHGMVFLASRDQGGIESSVAVKVPARPGALDAEGAALMRFAHPNVVKLIDGPLSNGALVLEWCDLGTLADRLRQETLSPTEVGALLAALLPAVAHMHDEGWIHGDISPANIGLRVAGGPALLDFATARPADGTSVAEGTAEFAGPLRQADPRLDIRALAATTLAALGEPDRWDHRKRHAQERLVALIDRCDNGQDVSFNDLEGIAGSIAPVAAPGSTRAGSLGGGPDVTQSTRAFGPPPVGQTSNPSPDPKTWKYAVLASALCLLALTVESWPSRLAAPSSAESRSSHLVAEVPATKSLSDAGARWEARTGVITIEQFGEQRHFAAGEPGDLAAVGDWACSGVETLGVFRPSTGAWYEFASWADGSVAEVSYVDSERFDIDATAEVGNAVFSLSVANTPTTCDTPVVRTVSATD